MVPKTNNEWVYFPYFFRSDYRALEVLLILMKYGQLTNQGLPVGLLSAAYSWPFRFLIKVKRGTPAQALAPPPPVPIPPCE